MGHMRLFPSPVSLLDNSPYVPDSPLLVRNEAQMAHIQGGYGTPADHPFHCWSLFRGEN